VQDEELGRVMELPQVINFFNNCDKLHYPPISENSHAITQFFEDNDDDSDGKITEANFLNFYEKKAKK
jgi:hypothetical protein